MERVYIVLEKKDFNNFNIRKIFNREDKAQNYIKNNSLSNTDFADFCDAYANFTWDDYFNANPNDVYMSYKRFEVN